MSVISEDPEVSAMETKIVGAENKKKRSATLARLSQTSSSAAAVAATVSPSSEFTKVKRMNTFKYVVQQKRHPPLKSKALSFSYFQVKDMSENSVTNSWSETKEGEMPEDSLSDNEEVQEMTMDVLSHASLSSSGGDTPCSNSPHLLTSVMTPTETTPTDSHFTSQYLCSVCQGRLLSSDTIIQYNVGTLHLRCFLCGRCRHPMGAVEEFLVQSDGNPLCHDCTPSCCGCQNKIFHNHVSVLKKDYHEECLTCTQCKKPLSLISKVYANGSEPCCANCVIPVFNELWSPTKLGCPPLPPRTATMRHSIGTLGTLSPSTSTDSGVSDTASNDGTSDVIVTEPAAASPYPGTLRTLCLSPKLENLTRSLKSYCNSPALIRTSTSHTNLSNPSQRFSVSSLKGILFDEYGALLFLNYCVKNNIVEYIVFWLDVEHYRHFDGGDEDLKLFSHHIVTKYIGYYAELPVPLPRIMQHSIFTSIEGTVTPDIFDEAQSFIYSKMENELLHDFIQGEDGQSYLESLVERDLLRMKKISPNSSTENLTRSIRANVTNFDKRHMSTKFYVYEVRVEKGGSSYYIYRRYSEWHTLNQKLCKTFPLEDFPSLPKKIFLRRSQVKVVAEQRMSELQTYLQALLSMNAEVLNSYVLRQFLAQTDMDKEDEKFNKRIEEFQRKLSV